MTETHKEAARRFSGPMLDKGFKPVALHTYTDAKGNALYWRIRAKHPDTGDKWIRPMYRNGKGFELTEPKFDGGKPLYALHRIASNPDAIVWIVEGEQKADVLNKLGLVATTSGSATSAAAADWQPLRGRTCTLWPDNDEPGKGYAGEVARILLGLSCAVSCVDVAKLGLGIGEDVMQWLEAHPGAAVGDVQALPKLAPHTDQANAPAGDSTVHLIRGSEIKPEPIAWLWHEWIARGKLHIVAGAPGAGKTTLLLALAATITCGGRWPDGSRCQPGNALMWSGEDDRSDTLLPRFLAMGGDPRRIYFIGDVAADGATRPFDPARDMEALLAEAARIGDVALLGVDPIVNMVGGDSHKNTETRRALQPIVDLAARLNAAAVGITHYSKGTAGRDPVERVTGSIAFGALARLVFGAARRPQEQGGGRILARAKSNIGPDGGGYAYELDQIDVPGHAGIIASRVLWGTALTGTARELLAEAETAPEQGTGTDHAATALRELLAQGGIAAKEAQHSLRSAGLTAKQIRSAREKLRIRPRKRGFGPEGEWWWALPDGNLTCPAPKVPKDATSQSEGSLGTLAGDHADLDAEAI